VLVFMSTLLTVVVLWPLRMVCRVKIVFSEISMVRVGIVAYIA
jgi:hypothetical protein